MKKLKKYVESINLNFKKELIIALIVVILSLILAITCYLFKKTTIALVLSLAPVIFIFVKYYQYTTIKDNLIRLHDEEFINIINYMEIFLSNDINVYNALLNVKPYASEWMKEKIDALMVGIDNDKSVEPFIHFARCFKKPIIENVMIAIYQMMLEGKPANRLNQFDLLFQSFSENYHMAKLENKKRKIDALASLPLIGAAYITFILLLGIMSIMGEIIDVI